MIRGPGLRSSQKDHAFQKPRYVENFIQSIMDCLEGFEGATWSLAAMDGSSIASDPDRLEIAIANGFGKFWSGRAGFVHARGLELIRRNVLWRRYPQRES